MWANIYFTILPQSFPSPSDTCLTRWQVWMSWMMKPSTKWTFSTSRSCTNSKTLTLPFHLVFLLCVSLLFVLCGSIELTHTYFSHNQALSKTFFCQTQHSDTPIHSSTHLPIQPSTYPSDHPFRSDRDRLPLHQIRSGDRRHWPRRTHFCRHDNRQANRRVIKGFVIISSSISAIQFINLFFWNNFCYALYKY